MLKINLNRKNKILSLILAFLMVGSVVILSVTKKVYAKEYIINSNIDDVSKVLIDIYKSKENKFNELKKKIGIYPLPYLLDEIDNGNTELIEVVEYLYPTANEKISLQSDYKSYVKEKRSKIDNLKKFIESFK